MNRQRLKQAEADFLRRFPEGFADPGMVAIGKKHKMAKMIEQTQSCFAEKNFANVDQVVENLVRVISRSSMVSMFEKPKFREFANTLDAMEKETLADGLQERLYGDEAQGFEMITGLLQTRKLAKWSLVSICPVYFRPDYDVYVKPTTVKKIIAEIELPNLQYKPTPSWGFYKTFREQINELKQEVDSPLSPDSAAFTGFLMMSL